MQWIDLTNMICWRPFWANWTWLLSTISLFFFRCYNQYVIATLQVLRIAAFYWLWIGGEKTLHWQKLHGRKVEARVGNYSKSELVLRQGHPKVTLALVLSSLSAYEKKFNQIFSDFQVESNPICFINFLCLINILQIVEVESIGYLHMPLDSP